MIIVFGVLAVICAGFIALAESRDRPLRRQDRLNRMIQPAE